jgi:hypothetical protein
MNVNARLLHIGVKVVQGLLVGPGAEADVDLQPERVEAQQKTAIQSDIQGG